MKTIIKYILISISSIVITLGATEIIIPMFSTDTIIVNFDTFGGTYIESVEIEKNTTLTELQAPTKAGFVFEGFYLDDEAVDLDTVFTVNSTLIAKYRHQTYTITLETDGDNISSIEADYLDQVTLPEATKSGHVFLGWFVDDLQYQTFTVTENMTFEAQFEPIQTNFITIQFNTQGEQTIESIQIEQGSSLATIPVLNKTGYTFEGFYQDDTLITTNTVFDESTILDAKYVINTYTIDLISSSDNINPIQADYLETIELPDATKDGYRFSGWYVDDVRYESLTVQGDISLTARFEPLYYTITLLSQTGFIDSIQTPIFETYELPILTLEDHVFEGWFTQPNGEGIQITDDSMIRNDITLYAYFVNQNESELATVTFSILGEIDPTMTQQSVKNRIIELEQPEAINGLKFIGWEVPCEYQFDDCMVYTDRYGVTKNITLYAKFESIIPLYYYETEILFADTEYESIALIGIHEAYIDDFKNALDENTDLYIPGYYQGLPITTLDETFKDIEFSIRSLQYTDQLSSINNYAFNKATIKNLNVDKPLYISRGFEGVTIDVLMFDEGQYNGFQENGFQYANIGSILYETKSITFYDDMFANATIGSIELSTHSVIQSIGNRAFLNASIGSIELVEGLTYIGLQAFENADIASIDIPSSVIRIEDNALSSSFMSSITLAPNNQLTWVGSDVFHPDFELDEVETGYFAFENILVRVNVLEDANIIIPDATNIIAERVFKDLILNDITIPNHVLVIGDQAFQNVTLKGDLTLHDGLKAIGILAFNQINDINNKNILTLPSSLVSIKESAFKDATLRGVILPSRSTYIYLASSLFEGLTAQSFELKNGYENIPYAFLYNANVDTLLIQDETLNQVNSQGLALSSFNTLIVSDQIALGYVTRDAFNTSHIITTPYFKDGMFTFSNALVFVSKDNGDIIVPDGITLIGQDAIMTSLNSLDLNDVTHLTNNAFSGASINEPVIISGTVDILDGNVFGFDPYNVTFQIEETFNYNNVDFISHPYNFYTFGTLEDAITPNEDGLYILGNILLGYDDSIFDKTQPLNIPEGIEIIANDAFKDASLSLVTFPSSLKSIGYDAFRGNSIQTLEFPEGIVSIEYGAFIENPLTDINFLGTDALKLIAQYSFDQRLYETIDGDFKIIDGILFQYVGLETELVIPSDVKVLAGGFLRYDWYPLFDRHVFQRVTIPETVEIISYDAVFEVQIGTLIFDDQLDITLPYSMFIYAFIDTIIIGENTSINDPYFLLSLNTIGEVIYPDDFNYSSFYVVENRYY